MRNVLVPGTAPRQAKVATDIREELEAFVESIRRTGEATSITRVDEACKFLQKQNVRKITAAAVGQYCVSKWDGPRASSISNKPETLARVVKLYDALHQATAAQSYVKRPSADRNLRIDDPAVLAYIQVLESRNKQLQNEVERLIQGFKKLQPLQIQPLSASPQVGLPSQVSDVERESIIAFFKQAERLGLVVDDRQRLVDGRTVVMERPAVQVLTRLASRS